MKETLAAVINQANEALQMSTEIVNICSEAKGREITVLGVSDISDIGDYFILANGTSDRHVQGITNRILETLHAKGLDPITCEGVEKGHWVVLDYGEVIVHIFYEPLREHYDLEGLWAKAERLECKKKPRSGTLELHAA